MELNVNGKPQNYGGEPDRPLLWVLREDLGLTGTKYGCGVAACGACTVLIDGQPQRACVTPVSAVAGQKIVTIEGLDSKAGKAVQQAWTELDVVQCGWCQSGQIMTATALLTEKPQPSPDEAKAGMDTVLCRCGTYQRVNAGVARAAEILKG
ncbi:MAG TPA: isoquinoline 1-oxidoreductase [Alphaproteobacteria bacterium]|nr:isoquinoline 1-oxidoreductase [Alphaproteobacteria bacterium]HAJ47873.1 isoquinoline 1-oxidoreductase [Alphaproteobacteria bacterium]